MGLQMAFGASYTKVGDRGILARALLRDIASRTAVVVAVEK